MIYIKNILEDQELLIPVSYKDSNTEGEHRFILFNTVNLKKSLEYIIAYGIIGDFNDDFNLDFLIDTEPILTESGNFYKFPIALTETLTEGTYEYALINGNTILSRGVAIVGEFKNIDTQYHKTIEYEQY